MPIGTNHYTTLQVPEEDRSEWSDSSNETVRQEHITGRARPERPRIDTTAAWIEPQVTQATVQPFSQWSVKSLTSSINSPASTPEQTHLALLVQHALQNGGLVPPVDGNHYGLIHRGEDGSRTIVLVRFQGYGSELDLVSAHSLEEAQVRGGPMNIVTLLPDRRPTIVVASPVRTPPASSPASRRDQSQARTRSQFSPREQSSPASMHPYASPDGGDRTRREIQPTAFRDFHCLCTADDFKKFDAWSEGFNLAHGTMTHIIDQFPKVPTTTLGLARSTSETSPQSALLPSPEDLASRPLSKTALEARGAFASTFAASGRNRI